MNPPELRNIDMLTRCLHLLPPETAHKCALTLLRLGASRLIPAPPAAAVRLWGLNFPSPLGLAAGFDKNADATLPLLRLGFAFVEVGTVTPHPQTGNPKPRLLRFPARHALVNHMGLNGKGLAYVRKRLEKIRKCAPEALIGVNIGANTNSANPTDDYANCARQLAPLATYLALNLSCPNIHSAESPQTPEAVTRIVDKVLQVCAHNMQKPPPVLVKLAPDLDRNTLGHAAKAAHKAGACGLILGNTAHAANVKGFENHTGGVSGKPLINFARNALAIAQKATSGQIPLVSTGGISGAGEARLRLENGASLVQIYTALIYQGAGVAVKIRRDLCHAS